MATVHGEHVERLIRYRMDTYRDEHPDEHHTPERERWEAERATLNALTVLRKQPGRHYGQNPEDIAKEICAEMDRQCN